MLQVANLLEKCHCIRYWIEMEFTWVNRQSVSWADFQDRLQNTQWNSRQYGFLMWIEMSTWFEILIQKNIAEDAKWQLIRSKDLSSISDNGGLASVRKVAVSIFGNGEYIDRWLYMHRNVCRYIHWNVVFKI